MGRGVAAGTMTVFLLLLLPGPASAQRVDIFTALQQGTVLAEFRGNGDASVTGTITRLPGGPTEVVIPVGSVFRVAQAGRGWNQWGPGGFPGGFSGPGGGYMGGRGGFGQFGGRQGMFGLSSTTTRLAFNNSAEILIPTVCMDYGKPAPTPQDVLVILPPNGPVLTRLADLLSTTSFPQPAVQIAMWAMVDKAPKVAALRYLEEIIPGRTPAIARQRAELLDTARQIVEQVGLSPAALPMFR
ncbi:MAG: hypothetical protein H5T86_08815 [Armatimonadetes bacterium]|nr:hypothetical protein [Armatimonadota bacterium]